VSKKQHNLMVMVANNPAKAKELGIPQKVGAEFTKADKGKTFKRGGEMANTSRMNKLEELGRVNAEKASTAKGKKNLAAEKKRVVGELKYAKGGMTASKMGAVKTAAPSRDGVAIKGKTKGKMVVMSGNKGMKKGGYC
jgi:hypothetical protein